MNFTLTLGFYTLELRILSIFATQTKIMQIKILVIEKEDITQEVNNQLSKFIEEYNRELSDEEKAEKELRRLISGEDEEENKPPPIFRQKVNVLDYAEFVDFFFRKSSVDCIFKSPKSISTPKYIDVDIMVIKIGPVEYEALYDEEIFNELVELLNKDE
jgi:hypothetical protein